MCGRTACTLSKDGLAKSCRNFDGVTWRSNDDGYVPSCNTPPGSHLAVLQLSSSKDHQLSSMVWGLLPVWSNKRLSNARIETVLEKSCFSRLVKSGKRCVVVTQGYFEWKTTRGEKQPHFFCSKLDVGVAESGKDNLVGVMLMAALYDVNRDDDQEKYSVVVLTIPASQEISNIHHRMPAIFPDEESVRNWLQCKDPIKVVEQLRKVTARPSVHFYPVSNRVNYTQHKDLACICKQSASTTSSGSANVMRQWMASANKVKSETDEKTAVKRKLEKQDMEQHGPVKKERL